MSDTYQCHCGARGTYDELCDEDGLARRCGGTGELDCLCGGDLCVCHHHGATSCPGCEDCDGDEIDDEDWSDDFDDSDEEATP